MGTKKEKTAAIQMPALLDEGGGLLLHACCAPCSSAIVEWLVEHGVRPTIFYYNPNIWPREEYNIRKEESKRHAEGLGLRWMDGDYDHRGWQTAVCGLENEPERGRRCDRCFALRLTAAARKAQELGLRYFATTLASSRWKNLDQVNRAGLLAQQQVAGTVFWAQNWRKGGLQERRNQLLKAFQFYNQQYCGCEFSACQASALTKPLLRQQMRDAKRQHAGQLERMSADIVEKLTTRLVARDSHPAPRTVMAFWPLPDEVDLRPLIGQLAAQGTTVLLPRVTDGEHMELRRYTTAADMKEGILHIMEPTGEVFTDYAQIDVILVPGVAFDAAGRRLGRGRGYYDRFLPQASAARKIGVCFPFQRVAEVPTEGYDACVDEVI